MVQSPPDIDQSGSSVPIAASLVRAPRPSRALPASPRACAAARSREIENP